MTPLGKLHIVRPDEPVRKRSKPVKSYKAWLKAKGVKPLKIERTQKRKGDLELIGSGEMVVVR